MLWHGKNFRGIINKAKEMIFNNTGTDLISINAEDAIKEVNGKLSDMNCGKGSVSLTSIATETNATFFNRLYQAIDISKVRPTSVLTWADGEYILQIERITNNGFYFTRSDASPDFMTIAIGNTVAKSKYLVMSGTFTTKDYSNNNVGGAYTATLYY